MGNPRATILFIFAMQKGRLGGLEKGHFFKKLCDVRGLELAKSFRKMSN